uniref:Uncharacterized protein n=1 Tax=Arundo donax TaxID=35708 RepID=A0A0A9G6K0_ARUDO
MDDAEAINKNHRGDGATSCIGPARGSLRTVAARPLRAVTVKGRNGRSSEQLVETEQHKDQQQALASSSNCSCLRLPELLLVVVVGGRRASPAQLSLCSFSIFKTMYNAGNGAAIRSSIPGSTK